MTGALPAESQLLVYCCGYTYTFRLSEAWQAHYLLSHNFWYTFVTIPIHSDCQRHDRSITCWVKTSGILLWLYLYIQAVRGMTGALPTKSQLLVYCCFLWLYLYSQAVRGLTEALPTESQLLVYCCFLWLYLYSQAVRGLTEALPAESQLLVYCCGYTYTFRLSEAWQEHYLLSHNVWCTVGISGDTYTFRLSEAWQMYYLLSHNF